MSTILKALQRLENEKAPKPEMTLDDQVIAGKPTPPRRDQGRGWLGITVGLLGGIGAAVALIIFWPDDEPEAPVEPVPPPTAAPVVARVPTPAVAEVPDSMRAVQRTPMMMPNEATKPIAQGMMRPNVSQEVEVVERAVRRARVRPDPVLASEEAPEEMRRAAAERRSARSTRPAARVSEPRARAAAPPAPVKPAPVEIAAVATPDPPAPAKPEPAKRPPPPIAKSEPSPQPQQKPQPKPKSKPRPAAKPELVGSAVEKSEPKAAARPPTPVAPSADYKVVRRAAVPDLRVRRTVWHPDPTRRLAVVELVDQGETVELREGDALGPLVLKSVKPSGARFVHDGVEIDHSIRND